MHNNHEGKVCDAAVKVIEKRTGRIRTQVRRPEVDRVGPPVDLRFKLGDQEYAIEHTLVEPFENRIKMEVIVNEILDYFKKNLPVPFPSSAYYELRYTIGISLPNGRNKRNRALKSLANWICKHEVLLRDMMMHWPMGPYGPYRSDHSAYGKPDGFQCEFELLCWPYATLTGLQPGSLWLRAAYPENIKPLIRERLMSAFLKKCKKLQSCKSEGARTVLVLESMDSALTHFEFRGDLLPDVLARHSNVPDEIFLVQTNSDHWRVVPLKYADGHWPDVGMPPWEYLIMIQKTPAFQNGWTASHNIFARDCNWIRCKLPSIQDLLLNHSRRMNSMI